MRRRSQTVCSCSNRNGTHLFEIYQLTCWFILPQIIVGTLNGGRVSRGGDDNDEKEKNEDNRGDECHQQTFWPRPVANFVAHSFHTRLSIGAKVIDATISVESERSFIVVVELYVAIVRCGHWIIHATSTATRHPRRVRHDDYSIIIKSGTETVALSLVPAMSPKQQKYIDRLQKHDWHSRLPKTPLLPAGFTRVCVPTRFWYFLYHVTSGTHHTLEAAPPAPNNNMCRLHIFTLATGAPRWVMLAQGLPRHWSSGRADDAIPGDLVPQWVSLKADKTHYTAPWLATRL